MSFDSMFDYTPAKDYLNGRITLFENDNANVVSELNMIANLNSEFLPLCNVRCAYLTTRKQCNTNNISIYGNALADVNVVEVFSEVTKNNMVQFYDTHMSRLHPSYDGNPTVVKKHFMRQMFCNPVKMTSDVGNLIAANITSDDANCIAMMIDKEYGPEEYSRFLLL